MGHTTIPDTVSDLTLVQGDITTHLFQSRTIATSKPTVIVTVDDVDQEIESLGDGSVSMPGNATNKLASPFPSPKPNATQKIQTATDVSQIAHRRFDVGQTPHHKTGGDWFFDTSHHCEQVWHHSKRHGSFPRIVGCRTLGQSRI